MHAPTPFPKKPPLFLIKTQTRLPRALMNVGIFNEDFTHGLAVLANPFLFKKKNTPLTKPDKNQTGRLSRGRWRTLSQSEPESLKG
jgi:hypothetical protein